MRAENGKQVTALVELQARLDEENNIFKARALQKAGVHVVYGMVGLKTHCKAALVVRRDHDGIRRYVHLGTGNYNPTTARLYTDLSFFTCRREFGEDASALFNLLTGYSQGHVWQKLVVAPMNLADNLIALIDRERRHAEAGLPARIIAKMNSLVDPGAIEALYAASQAGVRIDLIIRGICCLRPGLPGVSENIRVISIVDKFLEHSRISYFQNGDNPEVFLVLGRLDAAQLPPPGRDHVPDRGTPTAEPDRRWHPRRRPDGQRESPCPPERRHLPTRWPTALRRARDPLAGRVPEHGPRALERCADPALPIGFGASGDGRS